MPADRTVVLVNARVWPRGRPARDRRGDKIGPARRATGERIDLGGATVVPGLVDAHVHFPSWALGRRELRLFGTRSLAEALERIEAAEKPGTGLAARPRLARGGVAGGRAADARGARRGDRRRPDRAARARRAHAVGELGRARAGGAAAPAAREPTRRRRHPARARRVGLLRHVRRRHAAPRPSTRSATRSPPRMPPASPACTTRTARAARPRRSPRCARPAS